MARRTIGLLVALAIGPSAWRVPLLHHRHPMGKEVLTKAVSVCAMFRSGWGSLSVPERTCAQVQSVPLS
jgi:hypothetical protein